MAHQNLKVFYGLLCLEALVAAACISLLSVSEHPTASDVLYSLCQILHDAVRSCIYGHPGLGAA